MKRILIIIISILLFPNLELLAQANLYSVQNKSLVYFNPSYSREDGQKDGELKQVIVDGQKTIVKIKFYSTNDFWHISNNTYIMCKNPENFEEIIYLKNAFCVTKQGKYNIKTGYNYYDRHSFNLEMNQPYIIELHFNRLPIKCKIFDLIEPGGPFCKAEMFWENILLK